MDMVLFGFTIFSHNRFPNIDAVLCVFQCCHCWCWVLSMVATSRHYGWNEHSSINVFVPYHADTQSLGEKYLTKIRLLKHLGSLCGCNTALEGSQMFMQSKVFSHVGVVYCLLWHIPGMRQAAINMSVTFITHLAIYCWVDGMSRPSV